MKQSRSYWVGHVTAAKSSGLSLAQYARDHGVSLRLLYGWRTKFKVQSSPEAPSGASKVHLDSQRFVSVRVASALPNNLEATTTSAVSQPRCRLILAPGVGLEILELPDPTWLIALQRAAQGGR